LLPAQLQGITSQKTWISSNTTAKTSSLIL
jgi:hypothetical protein